MPFPFRLLWPIILTSTLLFPMTIRAEDEDTSTTISDVGDVAIQTRSSPLPKDWQQGPFIEIYVRGFQDSNGDGTGDLQGVINRLDYLKERGFKGIWLMPIYHSQDNNHGYTIRNFRKVEPRYGNVRYVKKTFDRST